MSSGKTYKLGDIAAVQTGPFGSQLHNEDYVTIGTPIVTVEHLGKRKFTTINLPCVSEDDKNRLSKYTLIEGDIVFSRVGAVDRSSFVSSHEAGWLYSGRCLRIRPSSLVCPAFLYYFFQQETIKQKIRSIAVGATMPSINTKLLSDLSIDLPTIDTQNRVAKVLGSFDDKIELNTRINHNLEEQAQALYKSWFVDFEPFKGGKFVNSELGMIPEGWRVLPFLSVARLCSGGTPKTDQKEFWNGSIPFFTPKDVGDSAFCLSTEKTITEEGLKNCNSSLYKAFTTFITARGTVGKLCMAGVPMAMNQTNYAICPASNIDVITLFIITKQLINSLRNKANGAVFDAITTRDFDGEKVTIAPQGVMDTFSSVVHPIYESILQNEMKNASLSQLRDSLLPKLMSGDFITSDIPC